MTRRIVLAFVILTLFVVAVLEIPLGITYGRRERDRLTTQLQRDGFFLAGIVEEQLEATSSTDLQNTVAGYDRSSGARVVVVDTDAKVVADTDPGVDPDQTMRTRPEFARALSGRVATGRRHSETLGTDLVYVAVPVASGGEVHGAVRLTYPTTLLDDRVRDYWWRLAAQGLLAVVGASVLGAVIARSATRPLARLTDAAHRFGAGDLATRADTTGPPEVRAVAQAFNTMAGRLTSLLHSQQAFVADASHQLRSPLTALRLRLENIADETSGEAAEDTEAALTEVQRMSRLVDGLLALARADQEGSPEVAPVDVAGIVRDRVAGWHVVAQEHGVHLELAGPSDVAVARAAPERVEQVVDNLLANALDAVGDGGHVTVSVARSGDAVEIHVVDDGPGLDPEARERAFDRFWRADPTRRSGGPGDLGGSGLGLPIARRLAEADRGTVELRAGDPTGIDAIARYPIATI